MDKDRLSLEISLQLPNTKQVVNAVNHTFILLLFPITKPKIVLLDLALPAAMFCCCISFRTNIVLLLNFRIVKLIRGKDRLKRNEGKYKNTAFMMMLPTDEHHLLSLRNFNYVTNEGICVSSFLTVAPYKEIVRTNYYV